MTALNELAFRRNTGRRECEHLQEANTVCSLLLLPYCRGGEGVVSSYENMIYKKPKLK